MNGIASLFSLAERPQKLESESKFLNMSSCTCDLDQATYCLSASCLLLCEMEVILLNLWAVRIKNSCIKPRPTAGSHSYYHCCWSNQTLWRRGGSCSKMQNLRSWEKPERQMWSENEARHCPLMRINVRKAKAWKETWIRGGRRMIWDIQSWAT